MQESPLSETPDSDVNYLLQGEDQSGCSRSTTYNGTLLRGHAVRPYRLLKSNNMERLAGLPCGMDGEILLAANKTHDSRQPVGRRKHVVVDRIARSRDVEELSMP